LPAKRLPKNQTKMFFFYRRVSKYSEKLRANFISWRRSIKRYYFTGHVSGR
jgi:hypothetical protein